jgi:hypothetical protein
MTTAGKTTNGRFVGVRMVNGVKTVTTYGFAQNPAGKIEQTYSTVQNQRTVSQEWTGVIYRSARQASDDSWHLNSAAVYEV